MKTNNILDDMLASATWGEFVVGELFELERGKRLIESDRVDGDIPYYSASKRQNGLSDLISNPLFVSSDKIIISTFGDSFYVVGEFTASDEITILENPNVDRYIGLFISMVIKTNRSKFMFGFKAFTGRLERQKIILPIDTKGIPDWKFMQEYMMEVERQVKPKLDFVANVVSDNRELDDLAWSEFVIGDLFDVQRGKRLVKKEQIDGVRPYISSTGLNNGVDNFISNDDKSVRMFENGLTVANSGSIGIVFYHKYKFVASDHVTQVKRKSLSRHSYLFVATSLEQIKNKYGFNRELSDKRLKRERILLPVLLDGTPDWLFMCQYMKRIENDTMCKII